MSLEKAIEHGKEKRKEYHGSKAFDATCRSHGGCPYCESGRKHKLRVADVDFAEQVDLAMEDHGHA